jgi:hypothetical protein
MLEHVSISNNLSRIYSHKYVLISPCLIYAVFRGLASVLWSGVSLCICNWHIFLCVSGLSGSDWNRMRYFMIATNAHIPRNHWLQAVVVCNLQSDSSTVKQTLSQVYCLLRSNWMNVVGHICLAILYHIIPNKFSAQIL